jgi:hypothetical protein
VIGKQADDVYYHVVGRSSFGYSLLDLGESGLGTLRHGSVRYVIEQNSDQPIDVVGRKGIFALAVHRYHAAAFRRILDLGNGLYRLN